MIRQRLTSVLFAPILACGVSHSANANLVTRLDGQAFYDTELDITWLANANAGAGSAFDDGSNIVDGRMS